VADKKERGGEGGGWVGGARAVKRQARLDRVGGAGGRWGWRVKTGVWVARGG